jgi:PAS domain S-box-containing protein
MSLEVTSRENHVRGALFFVISTGRGLLTPVTMSIFANDGVCQRTLNRLLEGCQIIGRDYRYLYVNDALARQSHRARHELVGRTMMEMYPGIEGTPLFASIRNVMEGGPAEQFDNAFEFPDGSSGWFELSIQPVPDGVCILSIDITERVRMQRLANRQQRLESLGTLASGVAHDLNNALAPILLSIGLLKDLGGADDDLLTSVDESASRAARLVRQLLTFSKGTDGAMELLTADTLVREIERLVGRTFPKSIRARYHVTDDLPPIVGDATQLEQVLVNLCINARDAMPAGGVLSVEATLTHVDATLASRVLDGQPGGFVTFTVCDTGVGIPPDVVDRIFEPFFTTKGPETGTGLGLSTSLGIIRSHRGFVHVQSDVRRGSMFRVFLPAAHRPHATAATGNDATQ